MEDRAKEKELRAHAGDTGDWGPFFVFARQMWEKYDAGKKTTKRSSEGS